MLDHYISNSETETVNIGLSLSHVLSSGDIILLDGDLGAGKTHFTKGIAKGLDIETNITSPTFTIVNEYNDGKLKLNHFDLYRISDIDELIMDIGFDEYICQGGITVLEWWNLIPELKEYLDQMSESGKIFHVSIKRRDDISLEYREITIEREK